MKVMMERWPRAFAQSDIDLLASVVGFSNSILYRNRRSKALSMLTLRFVFAMSMPSRFSISCNMIFWIIFSVWAGPLCPLSSLEPLCQSPSNTIFLMLVL